MIQKALLGKVLAGVVMVAVAGTLGALYTHTWNPMWNPFRPAPKVVLAKMVSEVQKLDTFHNETEINVKGGGLEYLLMGGVPQSKAQEAQKALISITSSSDVDQSDLENPKSKGDLKIKFSTEGMQISGGLKTITVGQATYIKLVTVPTLPISNYSGNQIKAQLLQMVNRAISEIKGQWIEISPETIQEMTGQEVQYPSQEEQKKLTQELRELFTRKDLYNIKKELPDQKMGGEMCYHYLVEVDQKELKKVIPEMFEIIFKYTPEQQIPEEEKAISQIKEKTNEFLDKIGSITAEVWIGQETFYPHKTEFEKEIDLSKFEQHETGKLNLSGKVVLSKFNQSLEISTPEESKTPQEIFESIIKSGRYLTSSKTKDARIIADMSQIRTKAELIFSAKGSYLPVTCTYDGEMKILCDDIDNQCPKVNAACTGDDTSYDNGGTQQDVVFHYSDNGDAFSAYTPLNTLYLGSPDFYCIDSSGMAGKTTSIPTDETCPPIR